MRRLRFRDFAELAGEEAIALSLDDLAASVRCSFKKRRRLAIESIFGCRLGSKKKIGSEHA
jgi:hypothetical protein